MLHGSKAKEWQHDHRVVKEVLKIATANALGMAIPIQENKVISKTIEANRGSSSQLIGIRKLSPKDRSIAQPKTEPGLQKVNARMASTGLARFRKAIPRKTRITMILNAKHSAMITVFGIIINALMMMRNFNVTNDALYILNVEVNKINGKCASGEPGQSDQGRTQLLETIGEKVVNQRHRLESNADEIHRLKSRVDQRHRLESGAKISNTHNVTRQVKGVS